MSIGIVIATRDRRASVLHTLARLTALPQHPPIALVDNASSDGTPAAVRAAFAGVRVLEPGRNLGAAGRTLGARALDTEVVAFCDDDSWWADDALDHIAAAFARQPRLGALGARILVGPEGRLDETSALMRRSPLGHVEGVGPRVLGFVACGAAVRRGAFLEVGGFHARFGVAGEEALLAMDLAAAGWELALLDAAVAHHHPAAGDARPGRSARQLRNGLWSAWLRRPLRVALAQTATVLAGARDAPSRSALRQAASGAGWVVRERRVVPPEIERQMRVLEASSS